LRSFAHPRFDNFAGGRHNATAGDATS